MQTMVTGLNLAMFEDRVNVHLSEGWVVVPGTSASGPLGFSTILEKPEEPNDLGDVYNYPHQCMMSF